MSTLKRKIKKEPRQRLLRSARRYLGRPYHYGAKISHAPRHFDCSSFIKFVYRKIGIDLPRPSLRMAKKGKRVPRRLSALKAGDLLFFRGTTGRYDVVYPQGIGHVVMYVGDGTIIHAKWHPKGKGKVEEALAKEWLLRKDFVVIRRIL